MPLTPSHSPFLESPSVLSHRLWEMSGVLCLGLVGRAGLVPSRQLWDSVPCIFYLHTLVFMIPVKGVSFGRLLEITIFHKYFDYILLWLV